MSRSPIACTAATVAIFTMAILTASMSPTAAQQHHAMPTPSKTPPTYHGEVLVPDPTNFMVGYRATGQPCTVTVTQNKNQGDMYVSTSLAPDQTAAMHLMPPAIDFFAGDLPNGQMLVLQLWQRYPHQPTRPGSLTRTTRQPDGTINYGRTGTYIDECHLDIDRPPTYGINP